jgi:hypothetical protein
MLIRLAVLADGMQASLPYFVKFSHFSCPEKTAIRRQKGEHMARARQHFEASRRVQQQLVRVLS